MAFRRFTATIGDTRVEDLVLYPRSRYSGVDTCSTKRFPAGTAIAYKSRHKLTAAEKRGLFGTGKVYDVTVVWDMDSHCPVHEYKSRDRRHHKGAGVGKTIANPVNFKPTTWQEKILETLVKMIAHIEIKAYAGSGKTTTLVWLVQMLVRIASPLLSSVVYLAFNKSIQEELSHKLEGTGCPARTTHSFGYSAIKRVFGNDVNVDNRRCGMLFLNCLCDDHDYDYDAQGFDQARNEKEYNLRAPVLELVSLAKNFAIFPTLEDRAWTFSDDQVKQFDGLISEFEIECDPEDEGFGREDVIQFALRVLARCIPLPGESLSVIDYDDMLYLPLVLKLKFDHYKLVLTDESQDFNACQIAILAILVHNGARLVFVGDPNQSLYAFRGADCDAFARIGQMLEDNGRELVRHILPESFRNAQRIIQLAQRRVPDFRGVRQELGTVETTNFGVALERANNERRDIALPDGVGGAERQLTNCDFAFLCRVNVPLFVTAYQLIGQGKRVTIIGRAQIGQPLKKLIGELCNLRFEEAWKKFDAGHTTRQPKGDRPVLHIADRTDDGGRVSAKGFMSLLADYHQTQSAKLAGEKYEKKLERLTQDVECLQVVATRVQGDNVKDILAEIDALVTDDPEPGAITLSTVHRSKGLEWEVVFLLRPDLLPHPLAVSEKDEMQERNAEYVAWTRAKDRLYFVENWPFGNMGSKSLAFERPEESLGYPEDVAPGDEDGPGDHQLQGYDRDPPPPMVEPPVEPATRPPVDKPNGDFEDDGKPFCRS